MAFFLCVAAGFTAGIRRKRLLDDDVLHVFGDRYVDWFDVCLGAISAAIMIALIQESRALIQQWQRRDSNVSPLRSTFVVEMGWRLLGVIVLGVCLVLRALVSRGAIAFPQASPEYSDLWVEELWWLAILTTLAVSPARHEVLAQRTRAGTLGGLAPLAISVVAVLGAIYNACILYLVHLSCAGVDAANRHAPGRYYLVAPSDQEWLATVGAFAVAAWTLAACVLFDVFARKREGVLKKVETALGIVSLLICAAYVGWFKLKALPLVSPDLAEGGRASSWIHDLGATVMIAILATVGSLRYAKSGLLGEQQPAVVLPVSDYRTFFCLPFLAMASFAWAYDQVRLCTDDTSSATEVFETASFLASRPTTFLQLAIVLSGLRLVWGYFATRGEPATYSLVAITPSRLIAAWVGIAALLSVGAATVAAYSFSWWLAW